MLKSWGVNSARVVGHGYTFSPPGTQTPDRPLYHLSAFTPLRSHTCSSLPLTTIIFRIQGFPTAQKGVEEKCPVVDGQTQVAWLGLGTRGQVGAKRCHCDELHQFHIGHVAKTAVIRVNSSHLKRVSNWRPRSKRGTGERSVRAEEPGLVAAPILRTTEWKAG